MNFDERIQKIYGRIQDRQSKIIFADRLNYSLTHDQDFLQRIADRSVRNRKEWTDLCSYFIKLSEDAELVIFGCGIWGDLLCSETKNKGVRWSGIIDSNPSKSVLHDIPVVSFDDFIKNYQGEYIVISSYKAGHSMKEQLWKQGIPEEKIVDAGCVIYELTEKAIYFDLAALLPLRDREVFVDAGCFDAMNTRRFFEWCGDRGFAYCFEPDRKNAEMIKTALEDRDSYEIVPRALWSGDGRLKIMEQGNFASSVTTGRNAAAGAPEVNAVSIDGYFGNEPVTYIKMDIEGAELEAIKGAENTIRTQHPRLAISIYHKPEDVWTIPEKILEYYPDYKFYLRHYSFSWYDTVLYAIP